MEGKEVNSGVIVKESDAPESYRVAARGDNSGQFGEPTMPSPVSVAMVVAGTDMKKKRGRPRKYGPDGKLNLALSPMPISSSIPFAGEVSGWKRGKGRSVDSIKKSRKYEFEGDRVAYYVGANFTPHVITVYAGENGASRPRNQTKSVRQSSFGLGCATNGTYSAILQFLCKDITMKVMDFSEQGSRAICILSANGTISNVSLRQPTSSGGTLTYEGRFEILSLSGSFMPTDNGGTKSRFGGMSVSLAGPDGRVVGGGLAGMLVAAGPVQVVVGSFLPGHRQEQKPKKHKTEPRALPNISGDASAISNEETKGFFGGAKSISPSTFSFNGDTSASPYPIPSQRNSTADNNVSLPEEELKGPSQSNCEVYF